MTNPLEAMFKEAVAMANARRRSIGMAPLEPTVRKMRDGTKAVGPEAYKLTIFLRPWHYADLIHFKKKHGISYGLNKIIERLIEDHIEKISARPAKPKKKSLATVTPITAKRKDLSVVVGHRYRRRAAG
jgi:hypothetical protein